MKKALLFKWIASLIAGLLVTSYTLDITRSSGAQIASTRQTFVLDSLKMIDEAVQKHRNEHGKLPRTLSEVKNSDFEDIDKWRDAWQHPIVYQQQGDKYSIVSYGRDGKAGGIGLDADLDYKSKNKPSPLPWTQVITYTPISGMVMTSFVSGVLTFLLAFFSLKEHDFEKRGLAVLAFKLIMLVLVTGFFAMFMTILHYPSGH